MRFGGHATANRRRRAIRQPSPSIARPCRAMADFPAAGTAIGSERYHWIGSRRPPPQRTHGLRQSLFRPSGARPTPSIARACRAMADFPAAGTAIGSERYHWIGRRGPPPQRTNGLRAVAVSTIGSQSGARPTPIDRSCVPGHARLPCSREGNRLGAVPRDRMTETAAGAHPWPAAVAVSTIGARAAPSVVGFKHRLYGAARQPASAILAPGIFSKSDRGCGGGALVATPGATL
jgi:hypothetical protein